jgi:hypothetical protein
MLIQNPHVPTWTVTCSKPESIVINMLILSLNQIFCKRFYPFPIRYTVFGLPGKAASPVKRMPLSDCKQKGCLAYTFRYMKIPFWGDKITKSSKIRRPELLRYLR